jgi:hypothetical protein
VDVLHIQFLTGQVLGEPVGSGCRIITTDGYQQLHTVFFEEISIELIVTRFVPAHLQCRTTATVDLVRILEIEVFECLLLSEQTLVAPVQADHIVPVVNEYFCYGTNHCIDPRSRSPCAKYCDCIFHFIHFMYY